MSQVKGSLLERRVGVSDEKETEGSFWGLGNLLPPDPGWSCPAGFIIYAHVT